MKFDGKSASFDKLADVTCPGTMHDEDQLVHPWSRTRACRHEVPREYGNPCQHFCPAAVYDGARRVEARRAAAAHQRVELRALQDVRHADPYQIITWTTPEGGGGPNRSSALARRTAGASARRIEQRKRRSQLHATAFSVRAGTITGGSS